VKSNGVRLKPNNVRHVINAARIVALLVEVVLSTNSKRGTGVSQEAVDGSSLTTCVADRDEVAAFVRDPSNFAKDKGPQ
jgi:hypothetical protein